MAYDTIMEFIETPTFTKQITQLLSDNSYSELQKQLANGFHDEK